MNEHEQRADKALECLKPYGEVDCDLEANIVDLFTDIFHLCGRDELKIWDMMTTAQNHYLEELIGCVRKE